MPPILLVIGALAIGGAAYAYWKSRHDSAPPSPYGPMLPPPGPVLPPPGPSLPPPPAPPGTSPTGNVIVTSPTSAEPNQTLPLVEPARQPKKPSESQLATARAIVGELVMMLTANSDGANYVIMTGNPPKVTGYKNRPLFDKVVAFQKAMNLYGDGLYGPATAGAVMYITGKPPPPPFFYTVPRSIKVYRPTP